MVPPTIHKTFGSSPTRERESSSSCYSSAAHTHLTPQNIDHQANVLLQYASPAAYGALNTALLNAGERLQRDGRRKVSAPRT